MDDEAFATIVVIFGLFLGIYVLVTDEYKVIEVKNCVTYSGTTGRCTKYDRTYACAYDYTIDQSIVYMCGKDFNKCNEVCREYNK